MYFIAMWKDGKPLGFICHGNGEAQWWPHIDDAKAFVAHWKPLSAEGVEFHILKLEQ